MKIVASILIGVSIASFLASNLVSQASADYTRIVWLCGTITTGSGQHKKVIIAITENIPFQTHRGEAAELYLCKPEELSRR